jgi:uncharacterized protein
MTTISLTAATYTENFDILVSSGSSSILPSGWELSESSTNANTIYTAGTGSSNAGDTYSFGASGSTDRALGGVQSGGLIPVFGVSFSNNTGSTITALKISYTGEQWRLGASNRADRIDFKYSIDAISLTTGTWADVDTLDFTAPSTTGTAGALDGNASTNRTEISNTITGLSIPTGGTVWLRWNSFDATGADDGLAIDNFSITPTVGSGTTVSVVSIVANDAAAAEAAQDVGIFRITRTGDAARALTVSYTIGGTATSGDYSKTLAGTATIPADESFTDVTITPIDDEALEEPETVILTLVDGTDYDLGSSTATVTIADNDATTGTIRIHDIQGAAHLSLLNGQGVVNVPGIVTAIASNGFYMQDPSPDLIEGSSEGIFIFTTNAAILSARRVGEAILVSGTVSEFRPGGSANNLTVTELINNEAIKSLSVIAWNNPPIKSISPTILGNGGRTIPPSIIDNDASNVETNGSFDPSQDGIDFYESLEGMLVQVNNPVTTSPTANFGTSEEIWVLADNGTNASNVSARGGSLITSSDFNPERIQIDDLNNSLALPDVNVGAKLSTFTGVINYDFGNYEVLVSTPPSVLQASSLQKEATNLTGSPTQLTVATFNVENLDPGDGDAKFAALASAIVDGLKSPDIINLEEIQDNNGATNDSVIDANLTLQTLINSIKTAGGPTYEYRQINPVDDSNGGEPGGNIRVGFLLNPQRVSFVDRPGGTSTSNTTASVSNNDAVAFLSSSPGLIDPTNVAFNNSRKPLVGEFQFNGQTLFVIGNHFNSKGGDQPLFGPNQPPTLASEVQRIQQATIVKDFVKSILAINPNSNIIVAGDLNDFEFSNPLTTLESGGLNTLIETLAANERYTYNYEGNAQVLDHIQVSNNLLSKLDGFDVVHINSEFADQVSDHDPGIARFNLPTPDINRAPTALNLSARSFNKYIAAGSAIVTLYSLDPDASNTFTYSLVSGNGSTDNAAFSISGDQLKIIASPEFRSKSSYAIRLRTTDQGGSSFDQSVTLIPANNNEIRDIRDLTYTTRIGQSVTARVMTPSGNIQGDVNFNRLAAAPSFTNQKAGLVIGQTGINFSLKLDQSSNSNTAKTFVDLAPLVDGLSTSNKCLAYFVYDTPSAGAAPVATPFTYDPIKKAGARFFDLDGNGTPDTADLQFVDGGHGDKDGVKNGVVVDHSTTAGVVSLIPKFTATATALTVADPLDSTSPAALTVRATLTAKAASVNQIGYVALNANEADTLTYELVRDRGSILLANLENSGTPNVAAMKFQRDINLINGQKLVFFEVVDTTLESLLAKNTTLQGFGTSFRTLDLSKSTDTAATASKGGNTVALSLLNESAIAGLGDLISSQMADTPILDFTGLAGRTLEGSVSLAREANYDTTIGFYRIQRADGAVRDPITNALITPGSAGYRTAALSSTNLFSGFGTLAVANGATRTDTIAAFNESGLLAPYATVAQTGDTFFSFGSANSDGLNHFRVLGSGVIGLEDIAGGFDQDFDDNIVSFNFKLKDTMA